MSQASDFATRFQQATEVHRAAERARDSLTRVKLVLPPRAPRTTDQSYGMPPGERLIAHVTAQGDALVDKQTLEPDEALRLAFWILETFRDDDQPTGFHHLECAVWKRTVGDCTCGLKTPVAP